MHIDLETARTNVIEKGVGNGIAVLGHDLEGRLDPDGIIHVHERRAEVPTGHSFDIVRHDDAAGGAVRPEPHEGQPVNTSCLHGENQQLLEEAIHRSVDRPSRKADVLPTAQMRPLKVSSHGRRQEGTQAIIQVQDGGTATGAVIALRT